MSSPFGQGPLLAASVLFPGRAVESNGIDVDGNALPDTDCTQKVKIEIHAGKKGPDGNYPFRFGSHREFTREHLQQQKEKGFFDLRIRVRGYDPGDKYIKEIDEIVITFENRVFEPDRLRGKLGILAVVVIPTPGEEIDNYLK
ncbi:MAG: hypothetical protein HYS12_20625 [Planctomycetes bacterium]|nr:hypothetical protein [Planctomycetota bacterium]